MITMEERVEVTEEKVDRLESLFGHFMTQMGTANLRMNRIAERIEKSVADMKTEATQERRAMNKRWGELAHKMGTVVEDIVAPNIPRIAREYFGWPEVDDFMIRRYVRNKRDRSKRREFDVVAVGGDQVIINETKATLRIEYIDGFLAALKEINDYFPEYADKEIIPIFASLYLPNDMVNYLTKHQVYAMAMADETMELLNFDRLRPSAVDKS